MWWLVLIISLALIAIGAGLLIRDFRKPREDQPKAPSAAVPEAIVPGLVAVQLARSLQSAAPIPAPLPLAQAASGTEQPLRARQARPETRPESPPNDIEQQFQPFQPGRLPALEQHWMRLRPEVDRAILALNESMAQLAVNVARPGEPTWSLHNRGFGDYRRVRVGGESVAWLRLELAPDLSISAHLRAHEARHELLNRMSTVARPLTATRIASTLSETLAPVGAAAARLMPRAPVSPVAPATVRTMPAATTTPPDALPDAPAGAAMAEATAPRTRGPLWPQWFSRPQPPATANGHGIAPPPPPGPARTVTGWSQRRAEPPRATVLIDTAVNLVNTAFAETGARLIPAVDALRREPLGPESRALSIDVAGTSVGLMLIEPFSERIDIAVGVANVADFERARRHSHDLAGLTVHPLAETIATCAWPAIAAAKGT